MKTQTKDTLFQFLIFLGCLAFASMNTFHWHVCVCLCLFVSSAGTLEPHLSALLWVGMLALLAIVVAMPQPLGVRTLIIATILRLIFSVGLQPTLFLLGAFNVCLHGETCD